MGNSLRVLWIFVLAVSVSCAKGHDIPVSSLPAVLKVPGDATEVKARGDGEGAAVEYHVSMAYPAEAFLSEINTRLLDAGWKPSEYDFLNPTIPSSHLRGWTHFGDVRVPPGVTVHQWTAGWQNRDGDVVSYALQYSTPSSEPLGRLAAPGNSDLHVTAFLIPSERAEAMSAKARQLAGQ